MSKTCLGCKLLKLLEEFPRSGNTCKLCAELFYQEHWQERIVGTSRSADWKYQRIHKSEEEEYVDVSFLDNLIAQQHGLCFYCCNAMVYGKGQSRKGSDGLTIQRIDNALAHIKSNCVLA
jgi:hypothetical protein